jgi:ribosomal protein S27AE
MDSITKSTPVFNAKAGVISYTWDDLTQEKPPCPHCGEPMEYWYSRKRGVIISDHKYTFMSPRFKCGCGLSDGKLMETQTANYFSDIYPIDCAVLSANA